jgi:glutamate synthase domain-containing protein 2
VATNNPVLMRGLVVEEKWKRVRNYHDQTVEEFLEIFAAAGCHSLSDLNRKLIYKNIDNGLHTYEDIYPTPAAGAHFQTA